MNLRFSGLCLAVLGVMGGLGASRTAEAGNVGYYTSPACVSASPANAIVAAGHTPVAITTLDAASLESIDALVVTVVCTPSPFPANPALNAAVANGLRLMIDTVPIPDLKLLPGSPALSFAVNPQINVSIPSTAPIRSGPAGELTNDSLDTGAPGGQGGLTSTYGTVDVSSLPSGGKALVVSASDLNKAAAFAYPVGAGIVVVSNTQWVYLLPGVYSENYYQGNYLIPGVHTYYTNTIAWLMSGRSDPQPLTTCASEGYTGTKLTWCQNICEKGYTGATLSSWIKRWTDKYRDLPYCAR